MIRFFQWKWEILALFFGVLLTFAFAPYDYGYFAPLALAFFYCFCTVQAIRKSVVTGYLFGLGLFGSGIWWVYISIHDFGGADSLSASLLVLLLVGLWALFPALTAVRQILCVARCLLENHGICVTLGCCGICQGLLPAERVSMVTDCL